MKRYFTLKSNHIYTLPIVILMPHSRCNCRCVMCDIWKGNNNVQQLDEIDVENLLSSLKELKTKLVVMSGGEALMHPNFFRLCDIFRSHKIKITVLSTGLLLKKHAEDILTKTNEVIVSLDGSEKIHDNIRNITGAYSQLKEGVAELKRKNKNYRVTGRCVIQRKNYRDLPNIVNSAKEIGLDQISFLVADVSTNAFNRPDLWGEQKVSEIILSAEETNQFNDNVESLIISNKRDFNNKFISESPEKLRKLYEYYAAFQNRGDFPIIFCNAPWISTVIEADGTVRPCFFHSKMGNIKDHSLTEIVNSSDSVSFRKALNVNENPVCKKCVCTLNLSPFTRV
jgi:MoaA/NifB/PqqE/SkfB family radical SAM enzyme